MSRSTSMPPRAGSSRRSYSRTWSGTSRLERVQSINASGHKYGLVYPGVGWAVWREEAALPSELIFNVNYLGGNMPTFALNFSRPGSEVIVQYYMFLHLGREGYERVQRRSQSVAMYLAQEIGKIGPYECLTDGSELPVFAFKLKDNVENYTVYDVSGRLRERGWQVPAYTSRRTVRTSPCCGSSCAPG